MTIEEGIYQRLSTIGDITSLIGTRAYPLFVPANGNYPCIVYRVTVEHRTRYSSGSSPLSRCTAEFECWGTTEAQADQIGQTRIVGHRTFDRIEWCRSNTRIVMNLYELLILV